MESLAKLWARDIAANPIPQQKSWLVKHEITVHEAIPIHKPLSTTEDFRNLECHIPYISTNPPSVFLVFILGSRLKMDQMVPHSVELTDYGTWISRWKLGSMVRISGLFHLLINKVYWGYNPLIRTFDPNFQLEIQVIGKASSLPPLDDVRSFFESLRWQPSLNIRWFSS